MELKDFIQTAASQDDLLQALQHQPLDEAQQHAIDTAPDLRSKIIAILQTVRDPEMPVNIWDLGLIYRLDFTPQGGVSLDMTLTAPTCPVAGAMPEEVKKRLQHFAPECGEPEVSLVWHPRWNKDMMSEDAKLLLDMW
jgi:metal-sulfur cluster biosynthetic enzyme